MPINSCYQEINNKDGLEMTKMTKLSSRTHDSTNTDNTVKPIRRKGSKSKPNSIHEILEQLEVPAVNAGSRPDSKWRSVRQVYDDFCKETSFTALTRIHKANHIYKRICWLVLCLGMLSWLSVQCFWLFEKYYSYPVETKIEIKADISLDFPSVTICNLNPLRDSQLRGEFNQLESVFELDDDDLLYDDYVEELNTTAQQNESTKTFIPSEMLKNSDFNRWDRMDNDSSLEEKFYQQADDTFASGMLYSALAVTLNDTTFRRNGHRKKDMILSCTWGGVSCAPKNFTYVRNNKYGNCFTFNSKNSDQPTLTTSYAGPMMGLTLELNIEQAEYIAGLSPDAGIRVTIHKRGTYPLPEDEGFSVAPGFQTSVGLSMKKITRLPPPHADCADTGSDDVTNYYQNEFGVDYTKSTCLKACYQQNIIKTCGCALSMFYVPSNSNVCDFFSSNFSNCMHSTMKNIMLTCSMKCPSPCSETRYDYSLSMSAWPSRQYEDHLLKKIQKVSSQFMDADELRKSSDTLVKIQVYFKDVVYEHIQQQKAYESQNLISDIGGQLGLWLGLSAITIGELFEFLASVFRIVGNKVTRCKRKNSCEATPITKVRPIDDF